MTRADRAGIVDEPAKPAAAVGRFVIQDHARPAGRIRLPRPQGDLAPAPPASMPHPYGSMPGQRTLLAPVDTGVNLLGVRETHQAQYANMSSSCREAIITRLLHLWVQSRPGALEITSVTAVVHQQATETPRRGTASVRPQVALAGSAEERRTGPGRWPWLVPSAELVTPDVGIALRWCF